jgi:transcriptional regulator with XRE-family HTH domain
MTPTPRQIGMKLQRLRKTRKLSQYALAKQAKVSREYVRKLEAGESDPTVGMLQRLADALGVPVTELLE